jgi:hypothetical protein
LYVATKLRIPDVLADGPLSARRRIRGMLLDLEMLVSACGRERTAAEYAEPLSRAKFRQSRVVPTAISIVEAVPA